MKPRRTHDSTGCLRLPGGTEDSDLWVRYQVEDGLPMHESVWELSDAERERIAAGHKVKLTVFGETHPPVMVTTCDTPLGKGPG